MHLREHARRRTSRLYGLVALIGLAGIVGSAFAAYGQVFSSAVVVTVESERAGLLLDRGSDVRVDGLSVGRVRSIEPSSDGGVRIEVAIDRDQAQYIGTHPGATIEASTTFGAKYIALHDWQRSGSDAIVAGAVIRTDAVATETNDLFAELEEILTVVKPSELNAMLTGMAAGLEGRGDTLGDLIETGHEYLADFESVYPDLEADLAVLPDVLQTYANLTPDLLSTGSHLAVTSRTLADRNRQLQATLAGISEASRAGTALVTEVDAPAVKALSLLRPVTSMLADFAPIYPCLLQGINNHQREVNKALGTVQPGYQGVLSFLPAQRGYTYQRDLPKIMPTGEPSCRSLPEMPQSHPKRHVYDDGTHVFEDSPDVTINPTPITIYEQLFGDFLGADR